MKRLAIISLSLMISAASFAQPTLGLISEYNFNDGTATDAIGGADGVLDGAIPGTDRFGNLSAITLNGTNHRMYVPVPAHDFSDVTTISMWVSLHENASFDNHQLFDTRGYDFGATSSLGWIDRSSNRVEFGTPGGGISQYNQVVATEVWHHLVMTMDTDNDQLLFYVNGSEVTDIAVAGSFIDPSYDNDTLYFGVRSDLMPSTHFHGNLDDIKIYDRVLTGGEVMQLYNDNSYMGIVANGLVSRYTFSGNTLDDVGGAHATNVGGWENMDRFMNPESSYWFDGSDDSYMTVANPVHDFSQSTTISMWVNVAATADNGNHQLFDTRDAGFSTAAPVGWIDRGNDRVEFGIPGGGITQFQAFIPQVSWTHLVMVIDNVNQEKRLYRNGVEITNVPVPGNWIAPSYNGDPMMIGIRADLDGISPFNGDIDDIRVYNRALNQMEADSLYHEGGFGVITEIEEEAEEQKAVRVFPNPTAGTINFTSVDQDQIESIVIFTTAGREALTVNRPGRSLDISDLPSGLYLMNVSMSDGTRITKRIAKQ